MGLQAYGVYPDKMHIAPQDMLDENNGRMSWASLLCVDDKSVSMEYF